MVSYTVKAAMLHELPRELVETVLHKRNSPEQTLAELLTHLQSQIGESNFDSLPEMHKRIERIVTLVREQ